jgi:X-domain of DnaJ-containing
LSHSNFGYELVTTIGKVYSVVAIAAKGSTDGGNGLPGVAKWAAKQQALLEEQKDFNKNKMDQLRAGLELMKLQNEANARLSQPGVTDEEREKIQDETSAAMAATMLKILWTTSVVDISATIHETCQMVFYDMSVDSATRQNRITAVSKLGEIWSSIAAPIGGKATTFHGTGLSKEEAKKVCRVWSR